MKTLKFTFAILLAFCLTSMMSAQSFQGMIEFTKKYGERTVTYKYFIKGDDIRIEEIGPEGKTYGVQLINIKEDKMLSFSPERKLYMDAPRNTVEMTASIDANSTGNANTVAGYKTREIVVKDKEEDRQITFHIADENFDFFLPMLELMNRRDKFSIYYQMLDVKAGSFPMKAIEVIAGKEESVLEVTKVEKKTLDANLFQVPDGYTKFER